MEEENFNWLDSWMVASEGKDIKNSKEFKILNQNNIDTYELTKHEKDKDAGEIQLNYKDEKEKEMDGRSFAEGAFALLRDMPEETVKSLMLAFLNGTDVAANVVGVVFNAMTNVDPAMQAAFNNGDGKKFKTLLNKNIQDFSKYLDDQKQQVHDIGEGSGENSKIAKMISWIVQDTPYGLAIHKKLKSFGIPGYVSLPVAYGIAQSIAFSDDASLFLNSEQVQEFKKMIKVLPNTSEEKLYNTTYRMLEGTGLMFLFPAVWKGLKFAKSTVPKYMADQQLQVALGGGAITGSLVHGEVTKAEGEENVKAIIQKMKEASDHPNEFPSTDSDFSALSELSSDPENFPSTDYDFEVILGQTDNKIPALEIIDEDKEPITDAEIDEAYGKGSVEKEFERLKNTEEKKTLNFDDQSSNKTMMEEFYALDKTQLQKISDATGYPVDELQSAGATKILSDPDVLKMLATKAGEVLPSLKKFTVSGFKKKTEVNFNKLAEEGKIGKDWYKRSGDSILKYVGGDTKAADQFAQLLAIYSPQKPIPTNTQFAIKAWNRFKSGEKIWDGEILEKAKLPENLNITQTNNFKKDLLAKYGGAKKVKGEKSTGLELVDLGDGNLMVVRHGNYSNIAEKTKDLKAHLLLNENVSWSGRKTNSFYGNIMKEINPELKQGATIDLWMNRAGGFVSQELKDGPKYNYIESIVNTVAKKKNWDIDQAQAAIWVSTKGRFDKTKSIFSDKALKQGIGIRKGGSVVPVKGKEREFADLRFNTAMNYKITSQDIEKAALNFADALEDNLAYVSWETLPGKFSIHLNQLEKATSQIKSEYHFKVSQILTDDTGADIIAKKIGILSPGHFEAPGYYKGVSNPSGQTKIATTRIKGAGKDVTTMDLPSQDLVEKYAAIRGLVLSQDAIGYHRLIIAASRKNANSVAIKFDKEFTPSQFKKFGQILDKEFGDGHALISKEKGILVLNVGDLDNIEFQKRLKNLAENTIETNVTFMYYKNGNLITKEATGYGKSYRDIIEGFQRSDIRQLLRDILSKKKNLDKEFSKKYGFDYDEKAFKEIESYIQR